MLLTCQCYHDSADWALGSCSCGFVRYTSVESANKAKDPSGGLHNEALKDFPEQKVEAIQTGLVPASWSAFNTAFLSLY